MPKRFVIAIVIVAVLACGAVQASEGDYLGLELGASWLFSVTQIERELGKVVREEVGTLTRQVTAVERDQDTQSTIYTIEEVWSKDDESKTKVYPLTKTPGGQYYVRDGEEQYLVFNTPLEKGSRHEFSLGFWEEWGLKIWGPTKRKTPLGAKDAWVAKEWHEYGDGSYVELTLEFVPYLGFLYEAKHERLFLEDCS